MTRTKETTVAAKVTQVEVEKAVENTKDVKVDTVVVNLANVKNSVGKVLEELKVNLRKEVQLLTDVQVAIKEQKERLKELVETDKNLLLKEATIVSLRDKVQAQYEEISNLRNEIAKVRESAQETVKSVLDTEKVRQELENMRATLNNALSNVGGKNR